MTIEEGVELLRKYDRNGKTFGQQIEYLISQGATRKEAEESLTALLRETSIPIYDEHGFLNEIDRHKKRKKS